jgi:hypothetical protein
LSAVAVVAVLVLGRPRAQSVVVAAVAAVVVLFILASGLTLLVQLRQS